jgi:hypothetical protein
VREVLASLRFPPPEDDIAIAIVPFSFTPR